MKYHRFTEIWPLMHGSDFEKFKADIAANGLQLPILTYQDHVLDGRNRERACNESGIKPRYEAAKVTSDAEALDLVVSLNEHRRHLSVEQRAFAAERLANLTQGRKIRETSNEVSLKPMTLPEAATKLRVSKAAAERARAIRKYGTKEDEADVIIGKVSLTAKADSLRARLPHQGSVARNRHASDSASPNGTSELKEKMVSIHVLIEELTPLTERLLVESKKHIAMLSRAEIAIVAGDIRRLLDKWASDDPTVRRIRGHVVPPKRPANQREENPDGISFQTNQ